MPKREHRRGTAGSGAGGGAWPRLPVPRLRNDSSHGAGPVIALAVIAGVLTAAALVATGRRLRAEAWLYALSLIALPLIYAGFAWLAEVPAIVVAELQAGLPFFIGGLLLVLTGPRHPRATMAAVGALWLLHGGYDLVHPRLFFNPGVPAWYPPYCAGVDVALGLYLASRAFSRRETA